MNNRKNSSTTPLKTQAKALRTYLAEQGVELGHGKCLEAVARQQGFKNWDAASAQMKDPSSPVRRHPHEWGAAVRTLPVYEDPALNLEVEVEAEGELTRKTERGEALAVFSEWVVDLLDGRGPFTTRDALDAVEAEPRSELKGLSVLWAGAVLADMVQEGTLILQRTGLRNVPYYYVNPECLEVRVDDLAVLCQVAHGASTKDLGRRETLWFTSAHRRLRGGLAEHWEGKGSTEFGPCVNPECPERVHRDSPICPSCTLGNPRCDHQKATARRLTVTRW